MLENEQRNSLGHICLSGVVVRYPLKVQTMVKKRKKDNHQHPRQPVHPSVVWQRMHKYHLP